MKRKRHSPEQIIRKLREADRILSEGKTIADLFRRVAAEEMLEPDLQQRRGRREGGDVSADPRRTPVRSNHHGHRVPADQALDPPLDRPIAGVRRLALRGDRVDVGGIGREGRDDLVALTPFDQPPQQEHRPLAARGLGDGLKRVDPLLRFGSIAVVDRRTGHRILE